MWPPSCMQYLQVSCIKTRKHKLMYSSKKTLINVHVYHLYLWSKHFFLDIKANNICKTCYSVMNSFWHCELSGPGVWKLKPPNIREPFALNNLASFYTLSHFPHSQLSVWVKKLPCDKKSVIALYAHIHVYFLPRLPTAYNTYYAPMLVAKLQNTRQWSTNFNWRP